MSVVSRAAQLCAVPLRVRWAVLRRLVPGKRDEMYQGLSQSIATVPGRFGRRLRAEFYSRTMRRCPPDVEVGFATVFATPDIEIGERVVIGAFSNVANSVIGDDVVLGPRVTILGGRRQHGTSRLDVPMRVQPGVIETVRIGAGAVLEAGATVAAHVGARTRVRAGAVVVKAAGSDLVLSGSPARAEPAAERGDQLTTSGARPDE
jgi:acetyltransferase-like isoleucine patch superfamily enzyme